MRPVLTLTTLYAALMGYIFIEGFPRHRTGEHTMTTEKPTVADVRALESFLVSAGETALLLTFQGILRSHEDYRAQAMALSTPPADDVREALAAARNVELYLDMLALDVDDPVHVVVDDGYDGDGIIQSLEVPDLRALVAFVRDVRPRGTVTDAERQAVADAIDNTAVITPRNEFLGGSTIANIFEVADAALKAARGVRS